MAHRIEINFPRHLHLHEERKKVDNPAFGFTYAAASSKDKWTLNYTYEAHSDHVEAGAIAGYLADIDRMRDELNYEVFVPRAWTSAGPPPVAVSTPSPTSTGVVAAKPGGAKGWWAVPVVAALAAIFGWRRAVSRPRDTVDSVALHRCVVCGETEESNPALEFRVATDGLDYCQRHLPSRATGAK